MRKLVLGDVHGAYKALIQVLQRANFDYEKDKLIFLGDVADGWSQTYECVEEFLKIKTLVAILGNHDMWTLNWMKTASSSWEWLSQGGRATFNSYQRHGIPDEHIMFFEKMTAFHEEDNCLFLHAGMGFDRTKNLFTLEASTPDDLFWDRGLFQYAAKRLAGYPRKTEEKYTEIFIGHTSTNRFSDVPVKRGEIWLMDQGAGWSGWLSLMDIQTKEVWQSDNVKSLYSDESGRR